MSVRFLLLLLAIASFAACGEGGEGFARAGKVGFDTAAGYRLGMLLPEARVAAAARGHQLECEPPFPTRPPDMPDTTWAYFVDWVNCDPGDLSYVLQFRSGSLRTIILRMDEDWDLIPVDTLVGRLSRKYGEPVARDTYTTSLGRREELVSWSRKGELTAMGLRCVQDARAGQCEVEYRLYTPEQMRRGK